ncbi:MAG: asparagine synthase (glutamine-hydrolyzing) [Synergistaceae bacterium]|nr:asparagine synthase (glutamine-hydrolyzing) [Synergistaceae bacterium]
MCGIAGIVNLNSEPATLVVLKKMTDAIAHRGTDGDGHFIDENVGIGHRRLLFVDKTASSYQPMVTNNGRYIISFDGEIYNYRELKAELQSLGYIFHSKSDTEVLLNAYAEWNEKCFEKLNGMFALAVYDKSEKKLCIARDRYGIKPLYYYWGRNSFLFGSEQRAILAHPSSKKEIDLEGLLEYFTFQNFFTDRTLLRGLKSFPAGCYAFLNRQGNFRIHRYWDYDFHEPEFPESKEEYDEELDRLMRQAVNRQLTGDIEIGAFLSGGMDSGSIVALASMQIPNMKTFTCGFDLNSASGLELAFDERSRAEYMSYLFKTEHYEMVLKSGDMERAMTKVAVQIEEPRVGQSYPNYYAAQLASKFVNAVLCGSGGDELFGGYPWRYHQALGCPDFESYIDVYYKYWQRLIPNSTLEKLFLPVQESVSHIVTRDIMRSVFPKSRRAPATPEDCVNNSLYFEAKTFLHGLLIVEDKLMATHGIEGRAPFLDNDVVDFAMKIPVSLKVKDFNSTILDENDMIAKRDFKKSNDGKHILRSVMSKYIPDSVSKAEKQGFSAPDASWFKGDSIEYVKRKLWDDKYPIYEYLDKKTVHSVVEEHLRGEHNRRLFIWSVLSVGEWMSEIL